VDEAIEEHVKDPRSEGEAKAKAVERTVGLGTEPNQCGRGRPGHNINRGVVKALCCIETSWCWTEQVRDGLESGGDGELGMEEIADETSNQGRDSTSALYPTTEREA